MTLEYTRILRELQKLRGELEATTKLLQAVLGNGDRPIAPEYLTPKQAAELTGISLKKLESLRSSRIGPPFRKIGRSVHYKVSDVHAFMDKGLVK